MSEEKKKAKELHLMFLRRLPFDKEVKTKNEHGKWTYDSEQLAKEHALICVDEIIKAEPLEPDSGHYHEMYQDQRDDAILFWTNVRKEIELI